MIKALVFILASIYSAEAIFGKCRALVLGGGSDRGAFQAGAISGLISNLPSTEVTYDVVSANGVGGLNALILGQEAIGNETASIQLLENFWLNLKRKQVYKHWMGGVITGYYYKTGLYDDEPLNKTVTNMFKGSFKRFISVGVTDLVSTNYYVANSSNFSPSFMLSAVRASLNDYGIFPVTEYQNYQLVSGDLVFPIDIATAVNACLNLGYKATSTIVDIITVTGANLTVVDPSGYNTIKLVARYFSIVNYHNIEERLNNAVGNYPGVTFRALIQLPNEKNKISALDPYDFTKKQLQADYDTGVAAAQQAFKSMKFS